MFRDEREFMMAEAQAEYEEQFKDEDEDEDEEGAGDDDWKPGCDSVADYCDGRYDPMTDW